MNKKILILLALLLFSINVFAIHCFLEGENPNTIAFNFNQAWSGCVVPTDIKEYSRFVSNEASLTLNSFGNFNMVCSNGSAFAQQHFVKVLLDGNIIRTNANNGPAVLRYGLSYCVPCGGGWCDGSLLPGQGTTLSIVGIPVGGSPGLHNLKAVVPVFPISDSYNGTFFDKTSNIDINFYSGSPSLLVLNKESPSSNFYERNGQYEKQVLFTIVNKSPLNAVLKNYEMTCSQNATCTIDKNYLGWKINGLTGIYLISGTIKLNKNLAPTEVTYSLNVDYNIPAFANVDAICQKDYSTKSNPVIQKFGLLDKQDFQINLVSSLGDTANCVGEDGMIGQTGEAFVPKVNLGFGGNADGNGSLISIDECDAKTIEGTTNSDAVYCSQGEFVVELARKVSEALAAGNATKASPYLSFESYLRTQDLSKERIQTTIEEFKQNLIGGLFTSPGLESAKYDFGTDNTQRTQRLATLFNSIDFINAADIKAGLYRVDISLNKLYSLESKKSLFQNDTTLTEDISPIEIVLTPISSPFFNWPFYDLGYTNINPTTISVSSSASPFIETNYKQRGVVLEMTTTGNNLDSANLYKTYAVPLSIKITGKDNNRADTNFSVEPKFAEPSSFGLPSLFTYWTGYASTLGNGCETIAKGTINNTLPYRSPDSFLDKAATGYKYEFALSNLSNSITGQTMYLDTVLFLPNKDLTSEGVVLKVPFKAFTRNQVVDGTSTSPASITINSLSTIDNFKIAESTTSNPNASIRSVFDGIAKGNICVNTGKNDSGKMQWTAFWNQNEIIKTLNCKKKDVIRDANFCSTGIYTAPTSCAAGYCEGNNDCNSTQYCSNHSCVAKQCENNTEKCEGTTSFVCNNYNWLSQGLIASKCGVECIGTETKCTGTTLYNCDSTNKWVSAGANTCGIVCTAGQTRCNPTNTSDKNTYTCVSNNWTNSGLIDGNCGYIVPITNPNAVKNVTFTSGSGNSTTCLIMEQTINGSNVKCAGYDGHGQLGDGSPTTNKNYFVPVPNLEAISLTSDRDNFCAITTNKNIKCWGYNGYGQIGDGTEQNRHSPTTVLNEITNTAVTNAVKVTMRSSAGYEYACALLEDKTVKCWGYNGFGQLGNGNETKQKYATTVSNLTDVNDIVLGGHYNGGYSCAIYGATRKVKCWGYNGHGQLGTGDATARNIPFEVPSVENVSNIYLANDDYGTTCAIINNGTIKCWGYNGYGQIGDGTDTQRNTPKQVQGIGYDGNAGAKKLVIIGAGSPTSVCALLTNNTVKCWGYNGNGQLGIGNNNSKSIPTLVSGLTNVTDLSGAGYSTTGHYCALLSDKTVKCWGYNGYGQIGNGTANNNLLSPTQVSGLTNATKIFTGIDTTRGYSCALVGSSPNAYLYCWGANQFGALGTKNEIDSRVPQQPVWN